jgi:hypothetical protein
LIITTGNVLLIHACPPWWVASINHYAKKCLAAGHYHTQKTMPFYFPVYFEGSVPEEEP